MGGYLVSFNAYVNRTVLRRSYAVLVGILQRAHNELYNFAAFGGYGYPHSMETYLGFLTSFNKTMETLLISVYENVTYGCYGMTCDIYILFTHPYILCSTKRWLHYSVHTSYAMLELRTISQST